MNKNILSSLLCLVVVSQLVWAAPLVQYQWDAVNYLPSSQGWAQGGTGVLSNDIANQALYVGSTPNNNPTFTKSGAVFTDPAGWTLTGILSVSHADTVNWAVTLGVDDGSNFWNFLFYSNYLNPPMAGVHTNPGALMLKYVSDINSTFHTFQMVYDPAVSSAPQLYMDGLPDDPAVFARNGGGSWPGKGVVLFGSGNSAATSDVRWQYVAFETGVQIVPEPASCLMLLLGTTAVSLRKRFVS